MENPKEFLNDVALETKRLEVGTRSYLVPCVFQACSLLEFFSHFCRFNIGEGQNISFRAFAADVGWPFSLLSDFISERKQLTVSRSIEFSRFARFSSLETEKLVFLTLSQGTSSVLSQFFIQRLEEINRLAEIEKASHALLQKKSLEEDKFQSISQWYHFALLSLMKVKDFKSSIDWMSDRLGISPVLVQEALDRLQRLGLAEFQEGHWKELGGVRVPSQEIPSAAIQEFHRQILAHGALALTHQSLSEREFHSMTLSLPQSAIIKAKQLIEKFCLDFEGQMTMEKPAEQVYALSLQFFRLGNANDS